VAPLAAAAEHEALGADDREPAGEEAQPAAVDDQRTVGAGARDRLPGVPARRPDVAQDALGGLAPPHLAQAAHVVDVALAIATATAEAIHALPRQDQRLLYWFVILSSLGEAARKAFEMLPNIQPFLSEAQRRLVAEGKAEGKAEGILKILAKRGISLSDDRRRYILACSDLPTLDRWFDRALTVATGDELFE